MIYNINPFKRKYYPERHWKAIDNSDKIIYRFGSKVGSYERNTHLVYECFSETDLDFNYFIE